MTGQSTHVVCISSMVVIIFTGVVEAACRPQMCTDCRGSTCYSCLDGFYISDGACYICGTGCAVCTGTARWQCTSCGDGNYMKSGLCSSCSASCDECIDSGLCTECEVGTYKIQRSGNVECAACPQYCTACDRSYSCTSCVAGQWGYACQTPCGSNCVNNECSRSTGFCTQGCEPGYYGDKCDTRCEDACATCTSATACQTCDDGYYNYHPYTTCVCETGQCQSSSGGVCNSCPDRWYPGNGGCCPCNENCYQRMCGNNGDCSQGCVKGFYGNTCQQYCNQIYDKCTECSASDSGAVRCTECDTWYYPTETGCSDCNSGCKPNSGQATCDPRTGTCYQGCNDGWYGDRCDDQCPIQECEECAGGSVEVTCATCANNYYRESSNTCSRCSSHCLRNSVCSNINGSCPEGCDDGWHGNMCDIECTAGCAACKQEDGACTECIPGKHGEVCDQSCSDGCNPDNNVRTCSQGDGQCTHGCVPGRWKNTCENICSTGCLNSACTVSNGHCTDGCSHEYFGASCQSRCSDNCLNVGGTTDLNICERDGGACSAGCNGGYHGNTCGDGCGNCQNSTCHRDNGTCIHGCVSGYTGSVCMQAAADGASAAKIGGAVGGSLAAIIVIVVVVIVGIILMRKRKREMPVTNEVPVVFENVAATTEGTIYDNAADNDDEPRASYADMKTLP